MLGCSTICPNCKHQFTCCAPVPPPCCASRRSLHVLSGGGLIFGNPTSPQVSPSAPISFELPPPGVPPQVTSEVELERLSATVRALRQSGWYYERLSYQHSDKLLEHSEVGTFLIRNSSDLRYLFSLSIQTEVGPKSVRLHYQNGYFRLDAQPHLIPVMPLFLGVLELVQHYVQNSKDKCNSSSIVWIDPAGKPLTVQLKRPLRRDKKPPDLKHLARLAINKSVQDQSPLRLLRLGLPTPLMRYLAEYPFSI